MKQIICPIIPIHQTFYNTESRKIIPWENFQKENLDYKAIATFISLGFMLDDDTFYNNIKVLKPSTEYNFNKDNVIISQHKTWNWYYTPKEDSFNNIVENFSSLSDMLIQNIDKYKKIILPLSGGLDSRTLLVPIRNRSNVTLSSYEFDGGINETYYSEKIAEVFNFPNYSQKITEGYLWNKIDIEGSDLSARLGNTYTLLSLNYSMGKQ